MKKIKYKLKKKYVNGGIVGNADPTTLYANTRKKSEVVDNNNFTNTQQGLLNRDVTQQQYQDNTTQAIANKDSAVASGAAARNTVSGIVGMVPGFGTAIAAGIGVAGGISDGMNQKEFDRRVNDPNAKKKAEFQNVIDPTTNLIQGLGLDGGGMNSSDLVSGLTAGLVNLKGSKEDKAIDEARYQKQREKDNKSQIDKYGAVDTSMQSTQAKNGKKNLKYKYKTGEKSIKMKVDDLVEEHEKLTSVMKSPSKKDDKKELKYQTKELKEYKKLDKIEDKEEGKEIETEGREPIFSPKKKDGTRDLIYYNPKAPTHKEGGVKAKVVKSMNYKKKGASSLIIPEGSAIITANGGKNKEALIAYKKGDDNKLEKIINKMPNDNPKKKKEEGDRDVFGNRITSKKSKDLKAVKASGAYNSETGKSTIESIDEKKRTDNTTITPYKDKPASIYSPFVSKSSDAKTGSTTLGMTTEDITKGFASGGGYDKSGTEPTEEKPKSKLNLDSLAGAASGLYNLGKGMFDKPVKTNRRYVKNEAYKYKDLSQPAKNAVNEEALVNANNIKNATGGQSSGYLGNMALASLAKRKGLQEINNQESGRRLDFENKNTELRNQQRMTNLGLANQYDDLDLQNKGKQSEYIGKGIEQLSNVAQMNVLNKNRTTSDDQKFKLMQTGKYKMGENGEVVPIAKKGIKNIKYKMKK